MAVSHLGGNGLPTEIGAFWIQVPRHRLERGGLHCPVSKAIQCYPLCNCSLDPVVRLRISPLGLEVFLERVFGRALVLLSNTLFCPRTGQSTTLSTRFWPFPFLGFWASARLYCRPPQLGPIAGSFPTGETMWCFLAFSSILR